MKNGGLYFYRPRSVCLETDEVQTAVIDSQCGFHFFNENRWTKKSLSVSIASFRCIDESRWIFKKC